VARGQRGEARTAELLTSWGWPVLVAALGLVVYAKALTAGFLADDFWQIAAVEGRFGPHRNPWSNYTFAFGDGAEIDAHRRRGSLPWWTTDDWHFGMLRPLSSLTLELDYRLFPRRPLWSHLHSYLWFCAVLFAGYRLYRRVFGEVRAAAKASAAAPWVAPLALLAFCIDESHAYALMWIANRCAYVSALFALLALDAHVQWRCTDDDATRTRARRLEWLWWILAFAGGEYATCAAAYVLAYELVGRGGPWLERTRALVPASVCTLGFIALYLLCGASSMGLAEYADPFVETERFFAELGYKLPRLLGETWATIPADGRSLAVRTLEHDALAEWLGPDGWGVLNDDWRHAALSGVGLVAVAIAILATMWRASAVQRRTVGWLALGACLAVVPLSSTMPQARLLVLPGLGVAGVFALVAERAVERLRAWPRQPGRALGVLTIAASLVALDVGVEWVVGRRALQRILDIQMSIHAMWTHRLPAEEIDGNRHVLVITQPEFITTVHGFGISNLHFDRPPATWHTLAFGSRAYLLRRPSANRLVLSAVGGGMFTARDERSFRRRSQSFRAGDEVELGLFRARITRLHPSGGVQRVVFDFRLPLDDERWLFLTARKDGLTPTELPRVGGQTVVPLATIPRVKDGEPVFSRPDD